MKRFILTGAPGAGKTAIIRQLELDGFSVVEEAATDLIALLQARGNPEPWTDVSFIDAIAGLQKERQLRASSVSADIQFHDRSAICTAALATYLAFPVTDTLRCELERIRIEAIFQPRVFFIRNLGFVAPLRRGGSVSKNRFVLNRSTKRRIATSALRSSTSTRQAWLSGFLQSRP